MNTEKATFEYVRDLFGANSNPCEYDIETAEMLDKAAEIFEFYRMKTKMEEFMVPDEMQGLIRKLTSVYAILNVRLGYYEAQDMKTYWMKNLTRVTKRNELYKNKQRDKLTESMIQSMADDTDDYKRCVEEHLQVADFANRLKLTVQSAKIMLDSLQGEQIRNQVERKYSQQAK